MNEERDEEKDAPSEKSARDISVGEKKERTIYHASDDQRVTFYASLALCSSIRILVGRDSGLPKFGKISRGCGNRRGGFLPGGKRRERANSGAYLSITTGNELVEIREQ